MPTPAAGLPSLAQSLMPQQVIRPAMQDRLQLQRDYDDLHVCDVVDVVAHDGLPAGPDGVADGAAAHFATSHVCFRVTTCRPSSHRRVPLAAASASKLEKQAMCVTLHEAQKVGDAFVVAMEPSKAQGIPTPIAILSALNANIDGLREGLCRWSCQKNITYLIVGMETPATIIEHRIINELAQCRAFISMPPEFHLAVANTDVGRCSALENLRAWQVVDITSQSETSSSLALTRCGMRRLRAARVATARDDIFKVPAALADDEKMLADATPWELLVSLKRQGWQVARKPSKPQLQRRPLPPHTADAREKIWYLSSASLAKSAAYMKSLLLSARLFASGHAVAVHHLQSCKYYEDILQHKSNGAIQLGAIADGARGPMVLQLQGDTNVQRYYINIMCICFKHEIKV